MGMMQEENGANNVNRIQNVTQDHVNWIKTQLLKTSNSFVSAKERYVFINIPNSNLQTMVLIPSKTDSEYRKAWAKVYNLALDYLEGLLSQACINGSIDYKNVNWPTFDKSNANYARDLEKILEEYQKTLIKEEPKKEGLSISSSKATLNPIDEDKLNVMYENMMEKIKQPKVKVETHNAVAVIPKDAPLNQVENKDIPKEDSKPFIAQKVSDGDKLNAMDFSDLRENNARLVILPCQDVLNSKEEKLFLSNADKCQNEGFKIGAFIHGNATNEVDGPIELKNTLKLFDRLGDNFVKFVIYDMNDKFISQNVDNEMMLLNYLTTLNTITDELSKLGYHVMISMDIDSKKTLSDITQRYELEEKYEIIYNVLVRELEEIDSKKSSIVIDPAYNYDIVTVKGGKFKNNELLEDLVTDKKTLAMTA